MIADATTVAVSLIAAFTALLGAAGGLYLTRTNREANRQKAALEEKQAARDSKIEETAKAIELNKQAMESMGHALAVADQRAENLPKQMEISDARCEERIAAMQAEMTRQDIKCNQRIDEIERQYGRRIAALVSENERLKETA